MPSLQNSRDAESSDFADRVTAHRNKLLGIWAAERMGMFGESAAEYVLGLVQSTSADDRAITEQVCRELADRGYPICQADVKRQLEAFGLEARAELARGIGR